MVEYIKKNPNLDRIFAALADKTRIAILERLRSQSLTISELAGLFSMSLAGIAKHIEVLSQAGLIQKVKSLEDARSFRLELREEPIASANQWLTYHLQFWTNKLDHLEKFIEEEKDVPRNS
ncbi:ArsR/SmtB family transcription factor [Leptospira sp. GIMC2001]|uniref:ArsR/SmtB family transcription factor n=1 Tax=Leptospira sp. GIMC2001 TaxID=1513297 RepID=UPI00234A70CB|nr:metalloregulator ArsR/SmtB family transcription factor [Leptospira sp. GIMC2001]WCL49266.1 metalloregulator ArsR/SmtB family transcription factor [Leptospira sp. GIMC2001]